MSDKPENDLSDVERFSDFEKEVEEYDRWVGLTWERNPTIPVTAKQRELAEKFENEHILPEPPWDNPLAKEESDLIKSAAADRGIGSRLYASFHIHCLAVIYECAPAVVHETLVDEFNNKSTEWTAFNFRFQPQYEFDSKVVFPRTGEVRKVRLYKTRNGKRINSAAAQYAGMPGIVIEKKLRRAGKLKQWTAPKDLPLFSNRLHENLQRLTQQELEASLAEVIEVRDGKTLKLDVIRILLWNELAWAVFGPGAQLGVLLVPAQTKIDTIDRLFLKNQIVMALGGDISNT